MCSFVVIVTKVFLVLHVKGSLDLEVMRELTGGIGFFLLVWTVSGRVCCWWRFWRVQELMSGGLRIVTVFWIISGVVRRSVFLSSTAVSDMS